MVAFIFFSFYRRTHFFLPIWGGGSNAANIASSKTFFSPFCDKNGEKKRKKKYIFIRIAGWFACGNVSLLVKNPLPAIHRY
jgi:hypothetical protein